MNIITRNFFSLLRSGALNEYEPIEPMSEFKWKRLEQMVHAQHVEGSAWKGIRNHQYDEMMNIPEHLIMGSLPAEAQQPQAQLSNRILNARLQRIVSNERHAIDTNIGALDVLNIIVDNVSGMLNNGSMLSGLIRLGSYLRNKGDKVDYVKVEAWLNKLHIRRMAQLQGSMLISVFNFEPSELPFVTRLEPAAHNLVLRSVEHAANDTAEEWHFRQSRSGFVTNNSTLLRRNLRRSLRYITYAPIETISNYFSSFARSLHEIEE